MKYTWIIQYKNVILLNKSNISFQCNLIGRKRIIYIIKSISYNIQQKYEEQVAKNYIIVEFENIAEQLKTKSKTNLKIERLRD